MIVHVSDQRLEPHCLGACLHPSVQLGLSRRLRHERLRFAPVHDVEAPMHEDPATGAPPVRRVARPVCTAVGRQHSLTRPGTCTRTPLLEQPVKNRPIHFSLDTSRTVGLDVNLQHSLAPNCELVLSMARKFVRVPGTDSS